MAWYSNQAAVTAIAGEDLHGLDWRVVKRIGQAAPMNQLPSVTLADDPTNGQDAAFGILAYPGKRSGHAVTVQIRGVAKIVCGGVVPTGSTLAFDAEGRAVVANSGDWVIGQALWEGAGAAGEIIPALVRFPADRLTF